MIIHAIEELLPESGGPTTVVVELALRQAASGERVAVLCARGADDAAGRNATEARLRSAGVEFIELRHGSTGSRQAQLDAVLSRLSPTIIHVHCIWERMLREIARFGARHRVPYVVSTHGMLHPYSLGQKWLKKSVYLLLFPQLLRGAAHVFTLNAEESLAVGARFRRPTSVLPNGIDFDRYQRTESGQFRRLVPALGSRPFILFVGRLHPIKGIDRLIAAYSNARRRGLDLDLVIVGPDGGARDALLAQARALRLEGNIHFPGAMFGEDKLDAFAACSIFAHRPRFECFGLTVVEALASARPVVTTRECRLDGGAEAGALLQVEDEDQAFASGLLSIASSRDRGAALGAAGRRWVGATFTWSAIAARLAEDYGRIAGCPAGPSESKG